jgi:hypothetical protein
MLRTLDISLGWRLGWLCWTCSECPSSPSLSRLSYGKRPVPDLRTYRAVREEATLGSSTPLEVASSKRGIDVEGEERIEGATRESVVPSEARVHRARLLCAALTHVHRATDWIEDRLHKLRQRRRSRLPREDDLIVPAVHRVHTLQ